MSAVPLTKQMEHAVQHMMLWDDCGGEGCDICRIAKVIVQAALPEPQGSLVCALWQATASPRFDSQEGEATSMKPPSLTRRQADENYVLWTGTVLALARRVRALEKRG